MRTVSLKCYQDTLRKIGEVILKCMWQGSEWKGKDKKINEKKCRRQRISKKNWRWRAKVGTEFIDRNIYFKIMVIKTVYN